MTAISQCRCNRVFAPTGSEQKGRCVLKPMIHVLAFLAACAPSRAPQAIDAPVLQICVVEGGRLRLIDAEIDSLTGDTLVGGQPFASVHPTRTPPYAAMAEWFVRPRAVPFGRHHYIPYAIPRVIAADLLQPVGEYAGVPLFAEAGAGEPEILYIPVRPGCEFQQYVRRGGGQPRG